MENRTKPKYFLISDLANTEWLIDQLERELNCRIQQVHFEKSMIQKLERNQPKVPYTVLSSLRFFAEKAVYNSGLDAGFAVSGFSGWSPAASFLQIETRHILFVNFQKKTELYESECLPLNGSKVGANCSEAGNTPLLLNNSDSLWNFHGLISKIKRKMAAQCPECNTQGWAPILKSKRFRLGDQMVGGEVVWLCRSCNYSRLARPNANSTHTANG